MNLELLNECIKKQIDLYINDEKIKILEIYDMFDICEIKYLSNEKTTIVDILGITKYKQNNKFISLHRIKGVNCD